MKEFFKQIYDFFTNTERKKVRARDEDGKYVADDKSTPDINEAYTEIRVQKGAKNGTKKDTKRK